ncbi:kynurenine 3-monooxygenase, mitochondrial precursor [Tulasnella sp. JGI-2019a]|nr:kynurenine 3-monooxygenase, mitochondrial precursor [Tulasnella sp. JGI-2019a]
MLNTSPSSFLLPSPPPLTHTSPKRRAIVVGAGPVGCLAALSLANAAWDVELYEGRADIRLASSKTTISQRSINLAISSRGIAALRAVEPSMATRFLETAIPMRGRMIHHNTGKLESQMYDPHGQCINSIERGMLNEELLDRAASHPAIRVFFQHKLTMADLETKIATFSSVGDQREVKASFDLCVGADGSYSNVRRQMMRVVKMDYQQEYISHEYLELRMPPGPVVDGRPTFLIDPNHLHIWPRHSFMLIALPNKDCSFTCTLFAPTADLAVVRTPKEIVSWCGQHFPDALALIGEEAIIHTLQHNPRSSLISIKANPYHYRDSAVIIGDAAHSMVPFYGQGLNCGLEDVRILQTILSTRRIDGQRQTTPRGAEVDEQMEAALEEYSATRHDDLVAICELAMDNYTEMRHDVTTPMYRIHKAIDTVLASFTPSVGFSTLAPMLSRIPYPSEAPKGWIPLYTMVTFRPDISYGMARRRAAWQSRCLRIAEWSIIAAVGAFGAWLLAATPRRHADALTYYFAIW